LNLIMFIVSLIKILLLNLLLSIDNVSVIALTIRELPQAQAKKANFIGLIGATVLRIGFCFCIAAIMSIAWLPVKLIGGLLLLKITWDLLMPSYKSSKEIRSSSSFLKSVGIIIITDLSMSIDNVLAIVGAANGNMIIVIISMVITIPIIFFGSNIAVILLDKFKMAVYIGGAVLVHTGFSMLLGDKFVVPYVTPMIVTIVPWVTAALPLIFGFVMIQKEKKKIICSNNNDNADLKNPIEKEI
jgi:YjbE family integral membrane protein